LSEPQVEPPATVPPASSSAGARSRAETRRRRHRWFTVGFVVAIVVVGVVAIVLYEQPEGPVTHVRVILLTSPDNACGIANETLAVAGYNSTGPAPTSLTLEFPNLNATSCSVESVSTSTSGFSVRGVAVPFSVAAHEDRAVDLSLTPPGTSFTGSLTLVFR
jgi:hypothetical protein